MIFVHIVCVGIIKNRDALVHQEINFDKRSENRQDLANTTALSTHLTDCTEREINDFVLFDAKWKNTGLRLLQLDIK